jgi:acyl-homoserine lactone acylase PvdQ
MRGVLTTAAVGLSLVLCSGAGAAPEPQPFGTGDAGGFRNVLPPGQNGHADTAQVAAFLATGARPPHDGDQLAPYTDLISASPTLDPARLEGFFKDATFGVEDGEVEHTYSPRGDVTIQRDRGFGVPHIYGSSRDGAMFGAGYIGAEDRLFLMDALRHVGRAELSSFVGGSAGNRDMDREQWRVAPYTEADLQRQVDQLDDLYGQAGRQVQEDVGNYVAGINKYICEAMPVNPECIARGISSSSTAGSKNGATPLQKLPGAYAAITPNGEPELKPELFKSTDVIATASLVGAIFGKGGGAELDASQVLQAAVDKFGADGNKVFDDFRRAEDPEAPVTTDTPFPYRVPPDSPATDSAGLPDAGSVDPSEVVTAGGPPGLPGGLLDGLSDLEGSASNALLVSGSESESGRPVAVFGPQTAYFSPQILMELDIHAPAVDGKPAIAARGASFPGVNLYVQLGRGPDYAWSATSAGQDIIDTFALDLCDPADPSAQVGLDAGGYRYRGRCEPFEELRRTNRWLPNAGDQTPPGSETLLTKRTKLGLEIARARIGGTPVVYVQLRSTYLHEADSAIGFLDFNTPDRMDTPLEFQQAAARIGFTFNWFYVNDSDTAYFNSGNNPVRPAGSDPDFPVRACPTGATDRCKYEWEGWNPDSFVSAYTPFDEHPQEIDKPFFTSWNNKQAPGYRAADDNFSYGSVHRSEPLDDGINARIAGAEKVTPAELVDAMEDAATVDLRGRKVLPFLTRALASDGDPEVRDALAKLEAWQRTGAHRRDENGDGVYEHSEAIKLMDAWWPRLVEQQFTPALGQPLYDRLTDMIGIDNPPHTRQGSAYLAGWYSYVEKDLRAVLGDGVAGGFSRRYCGGGDRAACEGVLRSTLKEAMAEPRSLVYQDPQCDEADNAALDDQVCFDAIEYTAVGAVTQPLQRWQNRPTFQQVVEVGAGRGAAPAPGPGAAPAPATERRQPRRERRSERPERRSEAPAPAAAPRPTTETGELPFTGFLVALAALLGALMLGGGVALRRTLGGRRS